MDFFKGLFATNKWPGRWHCGQWSDFQGWLYIISDLMTWLAYFLIPVLILNYFKSKQGGIGFKKVYLLFASFILLCGTTHFFDVVMFWIPMYRLNALIRFVTGVVSLFTVYHLYKILPEALRQKTNRELQKEIARREEAESELMEANNNLSSFAHVASHDLQEPLRKISTFSTRLYELNQASLDEKSKDYFQKVINSSQRMQTMITELLALSSLNMEVRFKNVSLNKVILSAMQDLEVKIQERNTIINIATLPDVNGNEDYLCRLFLNLLTNAIKFSTGTPVIDLTGEYKSNSVFIYVKDHGIGMRKEDTEKLFKPFVKLHPKNEYEGSGLGLSICKKIVEIHHGSISIESEPGIGTTFIIELPKPGVENKSLLSKEQLM